jgi:cytochrome oxidase assembly protein ShyY1
VRRVLLTPRWIAFTVLVGMLVVAMVGLGAWQLQRLGERRDRNEQVVERGSPPARPLADVLPAGSTFTDATEARWYLVDVEGTFDGAQEVRIRNRSQQGIPGEHVVTPLVLDDGTAVLVNRGFVPTNRGAAAVPPPPAGRVIVEGRVRTTQTRGSFGPQDPADGRLTTLSRVDVARIGQQLPYEVAPVYLELTSPLPSGGLPAPVPAPELGDGPHLSYAGQWFLFAACAVAGWFFLARRSVKDEQRRAKRPAPAP